MRAATRERVIRVMVMVWVLGGGKKDPSKAMLANLWDSLADLRGSEKSLFLYRAVAGDDPQQRRAGD